MNGSQPINLDPRETAKFDGHADQWWDVTGPLCTLHEINPLRLEFIGRHCPLQGRRVVDVGCGGGILSEAMARAGAQVTGIDLAPQALASARAHAASQGLDIDYREIAAEALADSQPGAFDAVVCMELIEHVPDPVALVHTCAALAAPGAPVLLSTVNRNPKSWLQVVIAAEYLLRLLPRGTHDYARFVRPAELAAWCRGAGLSVEAIGGMAYNPLTGVHRLTHDPSVNYLLAARRPG